MKTNQLIKFLEKNADLKGNEIAIKHAIEEMSAERWMEGYSEAVKHGRKRKWLKKRRSTDMVNRLLEKLSDLTHNKERRK